MGYKALITFDLPSASAESRKLFYEYLIKQNWTQIKSLTTAWKAVFEDSVLRVNAVTALIRDLSNAKRVSDVPSVEFALQLDKNELEVNKL